MRALLAALCLATLTGCCNSPPAPRYITWQSGDLGYSICTLQNPPQCTYVPGPTFSVPEKFLERGSAVFSDPVPLKCRLWSDGQCIP